MKKEIKKNKVSLWGKLDFNGHFLITASSIQAWLYSKNPKLANEFVAQTDRLLEEIKKEVKKRKQNIEIDHSEQFKEFEKSLNEEEKKLDKTKKLKERKPWFKFW